MGDKNLEEISLMIPRLEYCGNFIEIENFHHYVDEEKNKNPYNCSFDIKVKSGVFTGIADKCECDYKELQKFIKELEELLLFYKNEITFIEIGYGNKIEFKCDRTGHVKVSGEIYGDACSHFMKFEFMTDQTIFTRFIEQLKLL